MGNHDQAESKYTCTQQHEHVNKISAKSGRENKHILYYETYGDSLFDILNKFLLEKQFFSSSIFSITVSLPMCFFCLLSALSSPQGSDDWCSCVCACN